MIDVHAAIDKLHAEHPERFSWTVVQMMMGEPLSGIGPFRSKEGADEWIVQYRAGLEIEEGDVAPGLFVIPTVTP